jgi:hypothetical protein
MSTEYTHTLDFVKSIQASNSTSKALSASEDQV